MRDNTWIFSQLLFMCSVFTRSYAHTNDNDFVNGFKARPEDSEHLPILNDTKPQANPLE